MRKLPAANHDKLANVTNNKSSPTAQYSNNEGIVDSNWKIYTAFIIMENIIIPHNNSSIH